MKKFQIIAWVLFGALFSMLKAEKVFIPGKGLVNVDAKKGSRIMHVEGEQRDDDAVDDLYRHLGVRRWIVPWKCDENVKRVAVSLWSVELKPNGTKTETRLATISHDYEEYMPDPKIRVLIDKSSSTLIIFGSISTGPAFVPHGTVSYSQAQPQRIGPNRFLLLEVLDMVTVANGTKVTGKAIQTLEITVEENQPESTKGPNQALPTPASVTPAADAPVAPDAGAADL